MDIHRPWLQTKTSTKVSVAWSSLSFWSDTRLIAIEWWRTLDEMSDRSSARIFQLKFLYLLNSYVNILMSDLDRSLQTLASHLEKMEVSTSIEIFKLLIDRYFNDPFESRRQLRIGRPGRTPPSGIGWATSWLINKFDRLFVIGDRRLSSGIIIAFRVLWLLVFWNVFWLRL